jgi:hypothetical protein
MRYREIWCSLGGGAYRPRQIVLHGGLNATYLDLYLRKLVTQRGYRVVQLGQGEYHYN